MQEMSVTQVPPMGHWGHSFEEDAGDVRTYRPGDYSFPLARGRDGIEFHADGTFVEQAIGPTDANVELRGRWEYVGSGIVRLSYEDPNRPDRTLEIVESGDKLLRVRQR